jgi:hypothetical protein
VCSSDLIAVEKAGGIEEGGGSKPTGLEPPKAGDTVRKSGQLFGGTADGKGGVSPLSGMQEIGNFAFDMAKNALGSKMTENIKNPYMQMIANFAIQKGMNMGIDYLMKPGGIGDSLMSNAGGWLTDAASSAGSWLTNLFTFADGGPVSGPGTGRSDSIPAMLSNGEFVVNSGATKKYRPLLDALNYTKYADGTTSTPGSANALSKALGTDKQLNALGSQTDLLTSIDGSLRMISGQGTSSGTGLSFDSGLGGLYGGSGSGSISSGNAGVMNGVARSRATQQKPSTMDYVTAIGGSVLKSMAISKGIGMASTALFGATPMALASNFVGGAQLGMAGFTPATFVGPLQPGALTGLEMFSGSAAAAPIAETAIVAEGALATEGALAAAPELAAMGPVGWTVLAVVAAFAIFDSYGGGGGSAPPPKEPKFHAAMWVVGNNNVNAIQTMYETVDYHAVPDAYKTMAYGLLRVAFNATKSSEQVTKSTSPYDYLYMKVQFDRISMLAGKGAPSLSSLTPDTATEVLSWPAASEGTNLNKIAQDIINWVRDEFKKVAKAENLDKLDKAASALSSYTLDEISRGLIPDLQKGKYALDTSVEKGIYANNVAESNRIAELIKTAASKAAYTTEIHQQNMVLTLMIPI